MGRFPLNIAGKGIISMQYVKFPHGTLYKCSSPNGKPFRYFLKVSLRRHWWCENCDNDLFVHHLPPGIHIWSQIESHVVQNMDFQCYRILLQFASLDEFLNLKERRNVVVSRRCALCHKFFCYLFPRFVNIILPSLLRLTWYIDFWLTKTMDCCPSVSYQIRKIAGGACVRNAGNVFPATAG